MRLGYAIRDRRNHQWLKTRTRLEGVPCPVTMWVQDEEEAMVFRRLKDARRMLCAVRKESRHPEKLLILNPRWKVVG